MNNQKILIKNGLIVTVNPRMDILRGDILIEGNRIQSVDSRLSVKDTEVFYADDFIIVPGFVQTHIHLAQTLFRNMAEDMSLLDWLSSVILPGEANHTPQSLRLSAQLSLAELFRCGTTTIMDIGIVRHAEVLFESIAESGMRAVCGKMLMDYGEGPEILLESADKALRESLDLLKKWHGYGDNRIRYAFSPRFVLSSSDELLKQLSELARRYDVIIHSHASENKTEIELVRQRFGMSNIEVFDHFGLTEARLCLAHCIWTNETDRKIMKKNDVKVLHCPSANLKLGSGIAPVPDYLNRGINASLGADGAPCNNNLNIFTEMRLAGLIQKHLHGPEAMPAPDVFRLATIEGARALGMDKEIGSIEPGKKADIVFIKRNQVHSIPDENIYAKLIYTTQTADVRHVMIDGNWIMRDRQLLTLNEEDIISKIKL
ncbi:MAG: 5'-deoxyadenosine deaminase [Calditrichaeota bacterium]|nr:5'-deoxyadenosine deaminase [Calditrichota bacterium]